MALVNFTDREWKIIKMALNKLLMSEAVIDRHQVTLAEFNYIYDNVDQAHSADVARIEEENHQNMDTFMFGSPDIERRFLENRRHDCTRDTGHRTRYGEADYGCRTGETAKRH